MAIARAIVPPIPATKPIASFFVKDIDEDDDEFVTTTAAAVELELELSTVGGLLLLLFLLLPVLDDDKLSAKRLVELDDELCVAVLEDA